MQSKRDLLTAVYDAFNRRDIDAALSLMRPDVDWPNGMEGGRVHGHDEVRAYWSRQWGLIDPRVDPVSISDDDSGNAVVEVHQIVRDLKGNVLKDMVVLHVYRFREGLIESMDIQMPAEQSANK